MTGLSLLVGALCVWRVTHLVSAEAGPGDVLGRLRRFLGVGLFGQLVGCFYCLSLWVAALFSLWLADGWRNRVLFCLASSAGACLLQKLTDRGSPTATAMFVEDAEARSDHALLRTEERVSIAGTTERTGDPARAAATPGDDL